jgi:hypothetical protein
MHQVYEVRSGRRRVGIREAPTAQIALLDHLRSLGCRDAEVKKLGVDSIAWRGAVFTAVPTEKDGSRR